MTEATIRARLTDEVLKRATTDYVCAYDTYDTSIGGREWAEAAGLSAMRDALVAALTPRALESSDHRPGSPFDRPNGCICDHFHGDNPVCLWSSNQNHESSRSHIQRATCGTDDETPLMNARAKTAGSTRCESVSDADSASAESAPPNITSRITTSRGTRRT